MENHLQFSREIQSPVRQQLILPVDEVRGCIRFLLRDVNAAEEMISLRNPLSLKWTINDPKVRARLGYLLLRVGLQSPKFGY